MRLSKNKIAFIKHNKQAFEVLSVIRTNTHEVPAVEQGQSMDNVMSIIEAAPFMQSLGGKESLTINTVAHGVQDLIQIHVVSTSPDRRIYSQWVIYLTTDRDTHYNLLRA